MSSAAHVLTEVRGSAGLITLNRPGALNALSLPMIRAITQALRAWRDDGHIQVVAFRGTSKDANSASGSRPFGAFCAGGDIRFFHQEVLAANPELEDFFTEEYQLNHLIHTYPKPTVAFMDGIVMGGGMGISQGCRIRLVTENTKMAMPETQIGLFPDVAGGYFLSRCPGSVGEWLGLTGETISPQDAVASGLADSVVQSQAMGPLWDQLGSKKGDSPDFLKNEIAIFSVAGYACPPDLRATIDHFFSLNCVSDMVQALEADASAWAQQTAAQLRQKSPLMLHVTLEQIRRARKRTLAQELQMERGMMRHCFNPLHLGKSPAQSEVVEGIRAQVIDKDRQPRWSPARIEDVTPEMIEPFFQSPWSAEAHPLRDLGVAGG